LLFWGAGQKVLLKIQSDPVDCRLLALFEGLYRDVASGITEGACGPLLIHADKSKTKEKEAEERVRQRTQETATETITSQRWTVELQDIPDILVETTSSESMTQEVFMAYARHFVSNLPPDHGPVFLFLDGHGSRWNKYALKYFLENNMYSFILASHTSIWSQPNDARVNKGFHWAIEEACKKVQCTFDTPTVQYFNTNFLNGWKLFLKTEQDDLHILGCNNTTNTFQQTSLFPYKPTPQVWVDAIETIGQAEPQKPGPTMKHFQGKMYCHLVKMSQKYCARVLKMWTLILMT